MYLYSFLSCFQKIQTNNKPPTGLFKLNKAQMALSLSSWLKQSKRQSYPSFFIRLLFSFVWLQLKKLVILTLRWHRWKWKQRRGKKACKRTSTRNPRPLWNNWQNSRPSLKRMGRSRLGMLQWVRQSLGLWKCHLERSPNLLSLSSVSFLSHLWLPAASPGEKDLFLFFFYICNVCVDLAILFSFGGKDCWTSALQTSCEFTNHHSEIIIPIPAQNRSWPQ